MNINSITKTVLEENNTISSNQVKKEINSMIKSITQLIKKEGIDAKPILGGSAAKETYIGNDFDIDIFVVFNYEKYKNHDISKLLYKTIKSLKPVKIHGSRDYYQIKKRYEIVPVLKITNYKQIINITDASPLHAVWVNKKLKTKPKLRDEIKLTKLFFKGIKVYGAESYIKGISGHVTDILVIYYGSFLKTIENISKWKKSAEIDVEKHKTVLDKAKIGPLIVIDPIQPNRNAAAAVNQETYDLLIKKCKEFLKKPSLSFFKKPEINIETIKKSYNTILKVELPTGKNNKLTKIDVTGAKLLKAHEFVTKTLKDFDIEKSGWYWNKDKECYFYYKTKTTKLPNFYIQQGPSKEMTEHLERFKKKYNTIKFKKGKAYAKVKRTMTKIEEIINHAKKSDYLKNKVRGIEIVK